MVCVTIDSCAASSVWAAVINAVVEVTLLVAGGRSTTSPTIESPVPLVKVCVLPPNVSDTVNCVLLGAVRTQ